MQEITFENANGQAITFKDSFPYLLQNLSGISGTGITPLFRHGFQQNGVTFYGNLLQYRTISFIAVIFAQERSNLIDMRHEIFKVFNPSLGEGTLKYNNGFTEYQIECAVGSGPTEAIDAGMRSSVMQAFEIGLICPQPAWKIVQEDVEMAAIKNGVQFGEDGVVLDNPFEFAFIDDDHPDNGLMIAKQGDYVEIDYSGTLDAPLEIEILGPASMPKIEKTNTGEYIKLNLDLFENERLIINTRPDAVDAYKLNEAGVKTNAFNYIYPESTYFLLTAGEFADNDLAFSVGSGSPTVTVRYSEHYSGV